MKLSTLLLSSAALVVAGSAYAADLPAKKGAPAAKAATGCPAFGAGFWQIPGGDTCLKLSGYVRSNTTYEANIGRGTNPTSLAGAYGIDVDARNNSEAGVVRSLIRIENGSTSRAYVQLGGFTAGAADNPLDLGLGYNYSGQQFGGSGIGMMTYSVPVGSSNFTIGLTQPRNNNNSYYTEDTDPDGTALGTWTGAAQTTSASRPDLVAAFSTKAGALSLTLGAASHEVVGTTADEQVNDGDDPTGTGSANGYAFISNVSMDMGGMKLTGYAAYANGAAAYLGGSGNIGTVTDSDENSGDLSVGTNFAGQLDIPLGNGSLGLYAGRVNIKQGDTAETKETQYAVAYKFTVAKGLTVRPELAQTTTDDATENLAYIRIQRDF